MDLFKKTIIFLLLLTALTVNGQKLEYWDFKVSNEATARLQGSSLTDENSGKKAALIKIYTPFPNYVLGFDAGLFQILGRKQAGPGEVWLYVPERTQKVTVSHPNYSPIVIWFDGMEAEAGTTYTVELNVEGRTVALIASKPGAEIWVDGESQGKTPVNMRLPLGAHTVRAELGTYLYDDIIEITQDGPAQFTLQMEDESLKFGDVDIEVDGNAELWIEDKMVGKGSVRRYLREGEYMVTAKLPDHDDKTTKFTVEAGKSKIVTANPPVVQLGYIDLVTVPDAGVSVTMDGSQFELKPNLQMPVANYEFGFSKKGYYPKNLRFRVERNKTYRDTIRLERIQYVKKTTAYAAVAFQASGSSSIGFSIGGYYENVNLEASYNLGISRSKDVEWFDQTDHVYEERCNFRMDEMAVKVGYQLRFAERFGLTPQVGFLIQKLSAQEKNAPGNGFSQNCLTIGARFSYYPFQHIGFFITPEYGVPMGTKGNIEEVFKQGGIPRGGIKASIGISVSL